MNPKVHITKLEESNSPQQHDERVEEIELAEFVKLMRIHFNIFSEQVAVRTNVIRLTGSPYEPSNPDCRSMQVTAHARGTRLSPLLIFAVLRKFDISVAEYQEAFTAQQKLVRAAPRLVRPEPAS